MRRTHGSSSAVCLPSCGRYASLHSTTPDPAQRWGSSRPPILASLPSAQPPFLGGWGRNSGLRGELSLYLSRSYSKSSMSPIGSVTSSETTKNETSFTTASLIYVRRKLLSISSTSQRNHSPRGPACGLALTVLNWTAHFNWTLSREMSPAHMRKTPVLSGTTVTASGDEPSRTPHALRTECGPTAV